jgi:hypothetical protein
MALTGGDCDPCWASQEAVDGTSIHIQDIQFSCERVGNGIEMCMMFVLRRDYVGDVLTLALLLSW